MGDGLDLSTSRSLLADLRDPVRKEQAWARFEERYRPVIENWCHQRGLQTADIEDVNQTVLAKLIRHMPSFIYDPDKSFRAWLKTMVHRAVLDFYRHKARHPGDQGSGDTAVQEWLEQIVSGLVENLGDRMEPEIEPALTIIHQARQRVDPKTWEAFLMRVVQDQSGEEVAARLGMKRGSVYQAVKRVRKVLAEERARVLGTEGGAS